MASPLDKDQLREGQGEIHDYYTIDDSDADLVRMISNRIESAQKTFDEFKKEGKKNEDYWNKDHFKTLTLRWHNSRIIQNVVYTNTETMIPIITSRPAEPVISIAGEDEDAEDVKTFVDLLQKVILDKYNDPDYPQQELMEMLARHLLLYKIGIPKLIWYDSLDDYVVEFVHPHKIIVSADGAFSQDIWVAQYLEKTLKQLVEMFPDKKASLLANMFPGVDDEQAMTQFGNTPVGFFEYWCEDGSYVVWKMANVILQKKLNPYFIWTTDKEFDKEKNHLHYPHKPIMFLNSQTLGRHIWDDTTPISQVLPIQDGINMMQRIITDTSRDQGILVGGEGIDRDELFKYTGEHDAKLKADGKAQDILYRVPPKQLAPFVQDNLLHLIRMADNIMGTHSTTRGEESKNATLGQDKLQREADYGRIDAIVRGIERLSSQIYNWEVQMMLVKYKARHFQRVLGDEDGQKLFDMMREYNKRGIKIVVKPGSTLPTDKVSQRYEAIELAKMNRISNLDLYKRLSFAKPMEMAKNVMLEANAPEELYPDLKQLAEQRKQEQAVQKQEQQAQAAAQPPAPMPGEMPTNPQVDMSTSLQSGAIPTPPPPDMSVRAIPTTSEGEEPMQSPDQQMQPPVDMAGGTEHTEALLQGMEVAPFEGIPPELYADHVQRELEFMAGDLLISQPPEIQTLYAQHALAERQLLQGGQ